MVLVRRLVAAAVAFAVSLVAVPALASINQKVSGPGDGEVAGDSVSVGTNVTSTYAIVSVTVTIGGVTTPLPHVGGTGYQATVPLDAFAEGPLPATITATNVVGETVSATQTLIHDRVPTLTIASPGEWKFRSAETPIRVKATCGDTALYPCDHLVVLGFDAYTLKNVVLGTYASASVDEDFSVSQRYTRIVIEAYDTLGLKRSVTIPLAYDATPGLSVLHRVPGRALDMDATRILYTSRAGLFIRDIATGNDTRIGDDVGDTGTGALTLTGAVRDERWVSANRRYYVSGFNTGQWPGSRPITVDALTGASHVCAAAAKPYTAVVGMGGVTDVGKPVWMTMGYASSPAPFAFFCDLPTRDFTEWYSIFHVNDVLVSGQWGVYSDHQDRGVNMASITARSPSTKVTLAPAVPSALVPKYVRDSRRYAGRARVDFDTMCDWVAFTKLVGSDMLAFIRSPSGAITQRGIWSGLNELGGMGPTGELIVDGYLTRDGSAPVLFKAKATRAKWVEGRFLAFAGEAILESSASPPGGPTSCGGGPPPVDGGAAPDAAPVDAGAASDAAGGPSDAATADSMAGDAALDPAADAAPFDDGASADPSPGAGASSSGAASGGAAVPPSSGSPDDGGCATGGGPAGALGALAGALVVAGLARRRRVAAQRPAARG